MERPVRIFLVDRKQVAIIHSTEHTYCVRFVKSGKFMDVKKEYVKSWYPKFKKTKSSPLPTKPKNSQQSLDL